MARPSKPAAMLEQDNRRQHKTKAELERRKKAEQALLTGESFKESKRVKSDPIAHREFLRIRKLMAKIEKNDALFQGVINRYCLIFAEIDALLEERNDMELFVSEAKERVNDLEDISEGELASIMLSLSRIYQTIMRIDSTIAEKRKMLLQLEKECCMTVAAQLRAVPAKSDDKANNPLLEALKMD